MGQKRAVGTGKSGAVLAQILQGRREGNPAHMHKLSEVEEAKALMNEAKEWGVWKWLWEKSTVRAAADRAVDALAAAEEKVKAGWSEDLKKAYREVEALTSLNGNLKGKRRYEKAREEAKD